MENVPDNNVFLVRLLPKLDQSRHSTIRGVVVSTLIQVFEFPEKLTLFVPYPAVNQCGKRGVHLGSVRRRPRIAHDVFVGVVSESTDDVEID